MIRIILLCFLTCFSSFAPLKNSNYYFSENNNHFVSEKVRKNLIDTPNTRLLSVGDFVDPNYLNQYLNYLRINYLSNSVFYTYNWSVIIHGSLDVYVGYLRDLGNLYGVQFSYQLDDIDFTCSKMNGSLPFADLNIGFRDDGVAQDRMHVYFNYAEYQVQDGSHTVTVAPFSAIQFSFNGITESRQFVLFIGSTDATDLYNMFAPPTYLSDNYQQGYNNGYNTGVRIGYEDGFTEGQEAGYSSGRNSGLNEGYQNGYADGLSDGIDTDSTALTIFSGIIDIGLLPVNVFLLMFNYEVFGINIAGLVSSLLTIAIVIVIVRFILGGKNDK